MGPFSGPEKRPASSVFRGGGEVHFLTPVLGFTVSRRKVYCAPVRNGNVSGMGHGWGEMLKVDVSGQHK